MSYISLSKLYYTNNKEYENIYNQRKNNKDTINFNFEISGNPAFVVQDVSIMKKNIEIYKIDKEVAEYCSILPPLAVEHFEKRCLIDEIILSNDIEGIHSSRKEIKEVLSKIETSNKKKRFEGLVKKYLMLQTNNNFSFKECKDIRDLYNDLVYDEIKSDDPDNLPDGELFRESSASVYSETQKEIHKGVYPEKQIINYLTKALEILNNEDIDFLYRISIFHYLFGYIHPFYDGNGRTSRFISSCLLSQEFEPVIGYRISHTIKQNISKYYNSFKECNDPKNKGDLTPFVEMFVDIIYKSMLQLLEAMKKRYLNLKIYDKKINSLPYGNEEKYHGLYFVLIQAALFADDGITMTELEDVCNASRSTIENRLKKISTDNLVIKKKEGKQNYYTINLNELDKIDLN